MKRLLLLPLFLVALAFVPAPAAAVNLTLSESAVSNLFAGTLTLTLTGLTNEEPVLLQKFIDLNGNGTVDAGEPLVGQFKLVEGQVTRIGGVRNSNVPGDADGLTNGVIAETFDFGNPQDFAHHVANYLFRVTSPSGRFPEQVVPFAVTNTPLGQGVSGTVAGAPNAFVILLKSSPGGGGGGPFAGVLADGGGAFSISCPPGNYQVVAAKNGLITDFSTAPMVTVTPGATATANFSLAAANQTISGTLTNAVTGGVLPGVQVRLQTPTGRFALGYSDEQGNFSLGVTAGTWSPELEGSALTALGYVIPKQLPDIDTLGGSVTGLVVPLPPANALFYGTFLDGNNQTAIAAMPFSAYAQNGNSGSQGLTDAAGYYTVGVVAGAWDLGPDNDALSQRGILATGTNVTIAAGQAQRVDFTSRAITAHLTGQVMDNFGVPLTNFTLVVQPVPFPPSGAGSYYPSTDAQGNFDVGVSGGTWQIALESRRTSESNLVSFRVDLPVQDNVNQSGLVFVALRATQQITGFVREGSTGITNVQVYGGATINGTNYSAGEAYTDASGNYVLKVVNASWNVSVNNYDLNQRGYANANNQTVGINNGPGVANFSVARFTDLITLTNPSRQGSQFSFQVVGESGRNYVVETATNLRNPVVWTPVSTNQQGGPNFFYSDNQAAGVPRYYRARLVP